MMLEDDGAAHIARDVATGDLWVMRVGDRKQSRSLHCAYRWQALWFLGLEDGQASVTAG